MRSRSAREHPGRHYPLGTWLQKAQASLRLCSKSFCINILNRCREDTQRSAITLPTVHLVYGVPVCR
jgi:hypothetical protein